MFVRLGYLRRNLHRHAHRSISYLSKTFWTVCSREGEVHLLAFDGAGAEMQISASGLGQRIPASAPLQ